jgi:hypothetical protein
MSTEQTDNTPMTDEDVEGHRMPHRRADAERDETDDVEGHRMPHRRADSERDETEDDVEGHRMPHRR